MGAFQRWVFNLTGGRPMKRMGCLFVDKVSGKEVNLYLDGFKREWMANDAWGLFRVRRPSDPAILKEAQEGEK